MSQDDSAHRGSNGRFRNPGQVRDTTFRDFLRWQWTRDKGAWPAWVENPASDVPPPRVHGGDLRVSFVGHVSLLIQTRGLNILTDPVWSDRAGPFSLLGPKRVRAPGIAFDALPPIDLVLVSHNHYDHLDKATLARLHQAHAPRVLAPLGNAPLVRAAHRKCRVEELDWGQGVRAADGVDVFLEPMRHWSARGLFDKNKALWGAFVISTPEGPILFVGDSGYGGGATFRAHRARFGRFRLALLPIGAYLPRWFMAEKHMTPDEAVRAFKDLDAAYALATHFETFPLADDGYDEPRREFEAACARHQVPEGRFRALEPGQVWHVPPLGGEI